MKWLSALFLHFLANAVALFLAKEFIAGVAFSGSLASLAVAAAILTLIQLILRPILKLFFGPFILLSFGLFTVVLNALFLYLLDFLSPELTIQGYLPLLYATLLTSVVNILIGGAGKIANKD